MRWQVLALACGVALCPQGVGAQGGVPLLDGYDFTRRADRFDLPRRLEEVSGLTTTFDGRLFAHDDERGVVYEVDLSTRRVVGRFSLGDPPIAGDFEGIATVGERFFLVTSHGLLYEFREMPDGASAPYRVTDTQLGAVCEIEGLDYDAVDDALLFACKVSAPERGTIVVHRIPIDPARGRLPALTIDRQQLSARGLDPDFAPSALAVSPMGAILVLSAATHALIEVDRSGAVLEGAGLSPTWHRQPEGLAFGADGSLWVADEADGREPRLTSYGRRASSR